MQNGRNSFPLHLLLPPPSDMEILCQIPASLARNLISRWSIKSFPPLFKCLPTNSRGRRLLPRPHHLCAFVKQQKIDVLFGKPAQDWHQVEEQEVTKEGKKGRFCLRAATQLPHSCQTVTTQLPHNYHTICGEWCAQQYSTESQLQLKLWETISKKTQIDTEWMKWMWNLKDECLYSRHKDSRVICLYSPVICTRDMIKRATTAFSFRLEIFLWNGVSKSNTRRNTGLNFPRLQDNPIYKRLQQTIERRHPFISGLKSHKFVFLWNWFSTECQSKFSWVCSIHFQQQTTSYTLINFLGLKKQSSPPRHIIIWLFTGIWSFLLFLDTFEYGKCLETWEMTKSF